MEHLINPEIVGRRNELTFLKRQISDAQVDGFRLVTLRGGTGIGKTTLLREAQVAGRNCGFITASAMLFEQQCPPLFAWREVFQSLSHQTEAGAALPNLSEITDRNTAPQDGANMGAENLANLFTRIAEDILELASERPLMISLDGIQWLDQQSLDLLSFLAFKLGNAREYRAVPIIIICTARDDVLDSRKRSKVDTLGAEVWSSSLSVNAMGDEETKALLEREGFANPSRQFVRDLCETTFGNPRRISQAIRQLRASNDIVNLDGFSVPRAPYWRVNLETTGSQQDQAEFDAIDGWSKWILQQAALIGQRFDMEVLTLISKEDELTIRDAILASSMVVELREGSYYFINESIYSLLLSSLSLRERATRRVQIAETLLRRALPPSLAVGWHALNQLLRAESAASPDKLFECGRLVGDLAWRVCAWDTAGAAYSAAASSAPSSKLRAKMHTQAGTSYRYFWDTGQAVWHFQEAYKEWRASGDNDNAAEALVQRARLLVRSVEPGGVSDLSLFETALQLVSDDNQALKAYVLTRLCDVHSHGHNCLEAERAGLVARSIAFDLGDSHLINDACTFLGLAQQLAGKLDEAIESYHEAIEHAQRLNRNWLENIPRQRITMALLFKGDLAKARLGADSGLKTATQTNYPGEECMAHANLAMIAAIAGDFGEVETRTREMQRLFTQSRYSIAAYCGMRALAAARCYSGDLLGSLDAIAPLSEAGRIFDRPSQRMTDSVSLMRQYVLWTVGPADVRAGADRAEAQEIVAVFFARHLQGQSSIYSVTEICMITELVERLRMTELYKPLLQHLEWALAQNAAVTNGWPFLIKRVLASHLQVIGERDRSEATMREAIEDALVMGARFETARAQFELARILAAQGDVSVVFEAQKLIRQALDGFQTLGAPGFFQQAANLAISLGQLPSSIPHEIERGALSERRKRILHELVQGRTSDDISKALTLSSETINIENASLVEGLDTKASNPDAPVFLTLMVTDIEKSTPLIEALGDHAAHVVFRDHDEIVRLALAEFGGVEIKNRGDGILSGFHSVLEALGCARRIQTRLAARNELESVPIHARIGLHSGKLILREDGLFGLNIHITVRVCDFCEPGRVVVSQSVYESVQKFGVPFEYIGEVDLKGISGLTGLHTFNWRSTASWDQRESINLQSN